MAWMTFEILINLFQGFLMQRFMLSRLHVTRKHGVQDLLCIIAVALYYSVGLFFPMSLPDLTCFLIPLVYAWCIADDSWYVSVFWAAILSILFLSLSSLLVHIAISIPGSSYELLMGRTGLRIVLVLSVNTILSLTLYLVSKMKKDSSAPYRPAFVLFFLVNIALCVISESLYALQVADDFHIHADTLPFFGSAYVGLCNCIIFVILLFSMMSKSVEQENLYRVEVNAVAQSKHYQQELEQLYSKLCATKHDLKQHVQALEEMVRIGNDKQASDYLLAYKSNMNKEESFLTGSVAVDALLTTKLMTMKKNAIAFQCSLYPLNHLPIPEIDFCTILGNLLDNAIEGVLRINDNTTPLSIQLTFSRSQDMFYIYCVNPCNEQTLKKEQGRWLSAKKAENDFTLHAIGIRSMQRMIYEAEGRGTFETKNGFFCAKVVLPYSDTLF